MIKASEYHNKILKNTCFDIYILELCKNSGIAKKFVLVVTLNLVKFGCRIV